MDRQSVHFRVTDESTGRSQIIDVELIYGPATAWRGRPEVAADDWQLVSMADGLLGVSLSIGPATDSDALDPQSLALPGSGPAG